MNINAMMLKTCDAQFRKGTLYEFPKLACVTNFMLNFGGKLPILKYFLRISATHTHILGESAKKDPCLENFGPTHMGRTYVPSICYVPPPGLKAVLFHCHNIQLDSAI